MEDVKEMVVAKVNFSVPAAEETEMTQAVTNIEVQAERIKITTKEEFDEAAQFGKTLKQKVAEVTEFFAPMKKAAYDAHKQVCDREKAMLAPLQKAEKIIKASMSKFADEQERLRREAEEKLRKQAEEEAQRLLESAAKDSENGDEALAEAKLNEAVTASQIGSMITVAPVDLKQKGVGLRKEYEITGIDNDKVPVTFSGIEIRPVDTKAIMSLIKASKGKIQIPGITYVEKTGISLSGK